MTIHRDLPPSMRYTDDYMREIHPAWTHGAAVLEVRDPNSKRRYQYLVDPWHATLWERTLPPAPLDQVDDQSAWANAPLRWELVRQLRPDSPIMEWARSHGYDTFSGAVAGPLAPQRIMMRANTDGLGYREREAYVMPHVWPWGDWCGDITSYADSPDRPEHVVECPVEGCSQQLQWYEAGYVPGYRVCMARLDGARCDGDSIRHRFTLAMDDREGCRVLILDDRDEED